VERAPLGGGVRRDASALVSGMVAGFIMSSHSILMKPSGTSTLDLRSIIFSNDEPIFVSGEADGKLVDSTPIGKIDGNLTFQIHSPRLGFLNTTKGWSEAAYNM